MNVNLTAKLLKTNLKYIEATKMIMLCMFIKSTRIWTETTEIVDLAEKYLHNATN